jgi:hypothetical protein
MIRNCPRPNGIERSHKLGNYASYSLVVCPEIETNPVYIARADALARIDSDRAEHKDVRHPFIFKCVSSTKLVAVLGKMHITFDGVSKWHRWIDSCTMQSFNRSIQSALVLMRYLPFPLGEWRYVGAIHESPFFAGNS